MYKFKLYSKLYDKAKAKHDRADDYAIADIAAETPEKYGKYLGMAAGIGAGMVAGKVIGKAGSKLGKMAPKLSANISKKVNKVVPEDIRKSAVSMMGVLPMMNAGGDLGAKLAGKGTRNAILEEAEDRRRNPEKYQTEEERNKLIGNIKSPNLKFNKKKK